MTIRSMTPDPTPPSVHSIGYATPATHMARRWFSLRTVLLALLIVGFVQISFLVPFRLKPTFADFHLKLPVLTQLWLDMGDLWNASYGWIVAWPIALAIAIGITLLRRPPHPGNEKVKWLVFSNLALLAFTVILALTGVAAYQPMYELIEALSGK